MSKEGVLIKIPEYDIIHPYSSFKSDSPSNKNLANNTLAEIKI